MLIDEASAQTAEVAKAGADAGAVLLTQGGVLGAICVLLAIALGYIFWVLQGRITRYEELIERAISGLEDAAAAATGTDRVLTELRRTIDDSGKTLNEHSHQIAMLSEKVQHGFGNTSSAMQAVANELHRVRESRDTQNLMRLQDRDDRGRS